MAKRTVQFRNPETKELHKLLERIASRGQNIGRIFDDFLTAVVCCLALGTAEERYLEVARRYSEGEVGKRGIDIMAQALGVLVNAMEKTGADILGDFFEGAVTFGEHGQFFTPESLCEVMARATLGDNPPEREDGQPLRICDPACGSGRTLLAAAKLVPNAVLYGVDVDERCTKMTAINLALNGLRGYAVHGNSLSLQEHGHYSVGQFIPGALRWGVEPVLTVSMVEQLELVEEEEIKEPKQEKKKQLTLFDAA